MAPGRTKRDLLRTRGVRDIFPRCSNWVFAVRHGARLSVAAVLWLMLPIAIGCTQKLLATETSTAVDGGSSATCAGQECTGAEQCCANYECKNGRCTANPAGPGQACDETIGCMPLWGLNYTCESVENTRLCMSPSSIVKTGNKCQVSADCSSLNCVDDTCKPGPTTCGVSGSSCASHEECCSNQCGPEHMCINEDPTCRVGGDTCNPNNPDCCYNNSCSKIGSSHRCVATFGCRGPRDVCGEVDCCMGAVCRDNRCVELTCSPRDYPCDKENDGRDCCSGRCAPVNGTTLCVASDGCQPIGDKCASNGDCCSKNCEKGRCATTSSACGAEGEPCGDRPCCAGDTGKTMACVPDALSVKRCSSQTTCINSREKCFFGGQCCGAARCDYDASLNAFACNGYCRDLGDYCTYHSECCSNYCSPQDMCADVTQF